MAYTKTNWAAGVTPLSEANMDHLETQYDEIQGILTTRGDIFFRNATVLARLAKGTQYQVLMQGANDPYWGDSPLIVLKSADETVSNSTTLQNDDELLFAVAANEVWEFFIYIKATCDNTSDIKTGFTVPAAGAIEVIFHDLIGQIAASTVIQSGDGTAKTWVASTTARNTIMIWSLYIGGANAGNVQLQWAQATAQVFDTKVLQNSYIMAHQLA